MTNQISISKALKYRKRIQGEIARVSAIVVSENSVRHPEKSKPEREHVIREVFNRRQSLIDHLVFLNIEISKTNQAIAGDIIRLRELKGNIVFYKSIPTNNARAVNMYDEQEWRQTADIRTTEVEKMVRETEEEIDSIQDKLDAFNATTKITVPGYGTMI